MPDAEQLTAQDAAALAMAALSLAEDAFWALSQIEPEAVGQFMNHEAQRLEASLAAPAGPGEGADDRLRRRVAREKLRVIQAALYRP